MHLRLALGHELEPGGLKELLLRTAILAGVPGANKGFEMAQKMMEGSGLQPSRGPKK